MLIRAFGFGLDRRRYESGAADPPPDPDPDPPTEFLLLSSADELDAPAFLLLSGDEQSDADKLGLSAGA